MISNIKILVASAKGGVGKSTTALGLALAFVSLGKSVLLIDADFQSRSLDVMTGSEGQGVYNLGDIIVGRVTADRAIYSPVTGEGGLLFCPAPYAFMEPECMKQFGEGLNVMTARIIPTLCDLCGCDVTIIDTSSGEGVYLAGELTTFIDTAIITAEQSRTSVRAAEYTSVQMEKLKIRNRRLVVCGFDVKNTASGDRAGVIQLIDESELKCVGVVPYDEKMAVRQDRGKLPDEKMISQKAYRNIARRLSGEQVPLFTGMRSLRLFMRRLV